MENLTELINACRAADTEKITERKKQIEKIRQLLNKSYVIKALDKNSDDKQANPKLEKKLFGWDSLFQKVNFLSVIHKMSRNLIWREAETLQKAKNSESAVSQKKKQEICGLLKCIVRMADKRGNRLKGQEVVVHILKIMEDDFTKAAFGVDHTSILLKDILCVRKYWCELSEKVWHELLIVYSKELKDPPVNVDRVVLSAIIHSVIAGATQQCDVRGKKILPVIQEYFTNIKQERSNAVLHHMVSALNTLCQSMAVNGRQQVCKLGEQVIIPLLFVWNNRPSEKLKDELIKFFQLQMCSHHPEGAKQEKDGAFAVKWDLWKSNVRRLYEALYNDLQEMGGRNRFVTGNREMSQCVLQQNFVNLAADVCHQLFTESGSVIEVTQLSFIQETTYSQAGGPLKKRRLDSGWSLLRDTILTQGHAFINIPWLQLLCTLLMKYPSSIPEEEHLSTLSVLQQLNADSKKLEVTRWCLKCLLALAECQNHIDMTEYSIETAQTLWQKVWTNTLRLMSLHLAMDSGYKLLQILLRLKLVIPETDVWNLFIPNITKCCASAVNFLATYLQMYDLPESYQPQYMVTMAPDVGSKYRLRSQILYWLLPNTEEVGDVPSRINPTNDTLYLDETGFHPLAEVLVTLTEKDTRNIVIEQHCKVSNDHILDPSGEHNSYCYIEHVYIKSSFHTIDKGKDLNKKKGEKLQSHGSYISEVQKKLFELLQRDIDLFNDVTEPELTTVEAMLKHVRLCTKVLNSLLLHERYSFEQVQKLHLYTQVKELFKKCADLLACVLRKDGLLCLDKILQCLLELYSLPVTDTYKSHSACMQRSLTPSQLIDILFKGLKEKSKAGRSVSTLSTQSVSYKKSSYRDYDDDAFGCEDDTVDTQSDNAMGDDFDEITSVSESQESDGFTSVKTGQESLLHVSQLNEKEKLKLEIVKVLLLLCQCDLTSVKTCGSSPDVTTGSIKAKILDLLDDEKTDWDSYKAFDLQLLRCIVENITKPEHDISDEDLNFLLDRLGAACKSHKKDQDICSMVLSQISNLVPHLTIDSEEMVSESLQEARRMALIIMGVFWKQCTEGQYGRQTRMAVAQCMHTFFKNDPDREWTYLKPRAREQGEVPQPQYLHEHFIEFLKDRHHGIRLMAAQAIKSLFGHEVSERFTPFESMKQDKAFRHVYDTLQDLMEIEGRYSPDEQIDEAGSRTSSMLNSLATVACYSPVCEKKAVFAVCQMSKDRTLDVQLVEKVLLQIAVFLGYTDLSPFMKAHMPYLVQQWLENGYNIMEFPYKLVGCSNENHFWRECYPRVIPFLIMKKNMSSIKNIAEKISMELPQLLKSCTSKVLVHILPLFAASQQEEVAHDQNVQKRVAHANACYEMFTKVVQNEVVEQEIHKNMDKIVVEVLMTLHETSVTNNTFVRNIDPKPNPPYFNTYIITSTLDYLSQGHNDKTLKSLVSVLAKNHQDGIQKILLALTTHLSQTHRIHEKCRIMLMYRLFVKLLLKEFHNQLGQSWAFVLRDVIHTLVHNLNSSNQQRVDECVYSKDFALMCLDLMYKLCQIAVEVCPEELGRFLSTIAGALIPLVESHSDIKLHSLKVIHLLLVENHNNLRQPISLLDPLPSTEAFKNARIIQQKLKYEKGEFSLKQEIHHFLKVGERGSARATDRREGLRFLCQQLALKKDELCQLLNGCQNLDFESDLIRLIHELVRLTKSKDKDVTQEAGKCLGEIGPAHLSVIAIRGPTCNRYLANALEKYEESPNLKKYCKIFHLLDEYLIDSSIDLVCAASEVLKKLLSTNIGMMFHTDYKTRVADHLFQYLHPFKSGKKKAITLPDQDTSEGRFREILNTDYLWAPEHGDHNKWIRLLTTKLIESGGVHDEILRLLSPICNVQANFCEMVLPYLIHDILVNGTEYHRTLLSEKIGLFFARHCGTSLRSRSRSTTPLITQVANDNPVYYKKESLETMLNVVQYLRLQDRPSESRKKTCTAWDNNFWLDVDYLQLAKAALNCAAYFTAVQYADIWCNIHRDKLLEQRRKKGSSQGSQQSQVKEQFSQNSQLDAISNLIVGPKVQDLMLEAYRSIGDPDGVYGCGTGRMADTIARIKTYEHENEWEKALSSYDILLSESSDTTVHCGLMQSLQHLGTSHILNTYLKGLSETKKPEDLQPAIEDVQYHMALKNCNWDLDTPTRVNDKSGFHQALYISMISLKDGDLELASKALTIARDVSLGILQESSLESTQNLYHSMSQLSCVSILCDTTKVLQKKISIENLMKKWHEEEVIFNNSFHFTEPVLSQRCSVLHLLCNTRQLTKQLGNIRFLQEHLMLQLEKLARSAREAGRHQLAERAIHRLHNMDGIASNSWSWYVEEAKIFWSRGEQDTAKHLMKEISEKMKLVLSEENNAEALKWYPRTLGILGDWLAETRSENPSVVMEEYLSKAVEVLEENKDPRSDETAMDAYLSLARYADSQYQNIVNYMKSSTYEAKLALVKKAKQDVQKLRQGGDRNSRYLRTLEKQQVIDERESEAMEVDRESYLKCAIKNYLKCLRCGNKHDLRVFRLTSLWFDNSNQPDINREVKMYLRSIPSYKFLCLMYQLAARMSVETTHDDLFQPTLDKLIEKTTIDHPHHSLFIILALANANKDQEILQVRSSKKSAGRLSRSASSQDEAKDEDRVLAAKNMIERLKQTDRKEIITDMERLCLAYIELANFNVEQYKKETRPIKLPSALNITNLTSLHNVAMPTKEIAIDYTCEYKNITYIHKFEPTFKLAGGINLPKIISCIDSDGIARRQLVKGKDDLRQDAVMQQVFGMVNNLLQKQPETCKRKLKVRTYKVIPLSQRSGLLEWCEGTIPIGEYLIGSNGAHQRYRPTDWRAAQCRQIMNEAHQGKRESKIDCFLQACHYFQPVLRHFFMEKFPDPADWFQKQVAYTRSVATNSIVGYILGLGDRHVQNILIDCKTAELVHIDLGVAFEQGKILPTPETVPFRLTRDIVDGMGVAGVEGIFRRCCEKTMEVMHQNQEALLTILQVLLYDPLYAWTLSPEKAILLQQRRDPDVTDLNMNTTGDVLDITNDRYGNDAQENVNKVAERVLLRLQQKLQGIEENVQLSVNGQVNLLIQEARNPDNLCKLFPGWQPYL